MRNSDRPRRRVAVSPAPRLPQPIRRVEARGVLLANALGPFDAQTPEHGVDEPFVRSEAATLCDVDAGRHRRVRRGTQKQELSGAQAQNVLHQGRPGGQGEIETIRDQRIDLTEPPQHRRDQETSESAVAA